MTTTTIRRGALVWTLDGAPARVLAMRGGYAITDIGTHDPAQLSTAAPDPIGGARAFLETQTSAMRQWDNSALPNRREHETALAYIGALLELLT